MVITEDEMRQEITRIREHVIQGNLVNENDEKYSKMLGSTLRKCFDVGAMKLTVAERIERISNEHDLEITVKSGATFGGHKDDDWIIFTHNPVPIPNSEWFDDLLARDFETEREVETFFVVPLLEKLGYDYEDIVIGYPFKIPVGKKILNVEADLVIFNGPGRDWNDILMVIEAKNSNKDINTHHISQARAYAKQLLPAYYIVTNGIKISVFAFNGMKTHDSQVMDFDRSMLKDVWKHFYRCACKRATIKAKAK